MKQCLVCGVEFEPKNPKGVFCSNKCRQKEHRSRVNELLAEARKGKIVSVKIGKAKEQPKAEIKIESPPKKQPPTESRVYMNDAIRKKLGL